MGLKRLPALLNGMPTVGKPLLYLVGARFLHCAMRRGRTAAGNPDATAARWRIRRPPCPLPPLPAAQSDVAERAACSYSPVSTRSSRASSPISTFSSLPSVKLLVRHCSRISRYRAQASAPASVVA